MKVEEHMARMSYVTIAVVLAAGSAAGRFLYRGFRRWLLADGRLGMDNRHLRGRWCCGDFGQRLLGLDGFTA